MKEKCSNCKFYRFNESFNELPDLDDRTGVCRRFPPVHISCDDNAEFGLPDPEEPIAWYQPTAVGSDWCGEYKANE